LLFECRCAFSDGQHLEQIDLCGLRGVPTFTAQFVLSDQTIFGHGGQVQLVWTRGGQHELRVAFTHQQQCPFWFEAHHLEQGIERHRVQLFEIASGKQRADQVGNQI
jgi:hypothetical protein